MATIADDHRRALAQRKAAQIGKPMFGDQNIDIVFVVHMETIGTTEEIAPPLATDFATKIDRKALRAKSPEPPIPFIISVPRKHGSIDVTVDVELQRGVDADDAQPADDLQDGC